MSTTPGENGNGSANIHSRTHLSELLEHVPHGLFLLTAGTAEHRGGVLATWVQRCAYEPPMVIVALPKGMPVEPLIRDARSFALCQISADDRMIVRRFSSPPLGNDDPFIAIARRSTPSGAPIVDRALAYYDCAVVRHLDVESDHRLYIAEVKGGALLNPGVPAVFHARTPESALRREKTG